MAAKEQSRLKSSYFVLLSCLSKERHLVNGGPNIFPTTG